MSKCTVSLSREKVQLFNQILLLITVHVSEQIIIEV